MKALADARAFHIRLFMGRGRYKRREAATLDEARAIARQLERETPDNFGRGASIYCETRRGRTVHIE